MASVEALIHSLTRWFISILFHKGYDTDLLLILSDPHFVLPHSVSPIYDICTIFTGQCTFAVL